MSSGDATRTKRGGGSCPQCNSPYNNRYKPPNCLTCNYNLGGSYVPKKKARLTVPKCTLVVSGEMSIYSTNTSSHDDRCLVVIDKNGKICHHQTCKNQRAILANSQKLEEFECNHLKMASDVREPLTVYKRLSLLASYPCDDTTKAKLMQVEEKCGENLPIAVQVSPTMYCVFGTPTTNNTVGYCHVRVTEDTVRCCSKDCKTMAATSKQIRSKNICMHVHLLLCLGIVNAQTTTTPDAETEVQAPHSSNVPVGNQDERNTNSMSSRSNTIKMNTKRSLPNSIPKEIIQKPGLIDSSPAGWPEIFEPPETNCGLCNNVLGEARAHPGSRGKSFLLTELNPFKEIKVLVKMCTNPECSAMHQVFPYELGLLNVSDKIFVPFQILLEWRQLFRKGVPISIAIKSKLEAMRDRISDPPEPNVIENLANYLYNGYYCFEAMTERDLDSVICGICGIIGEVYLGDGNEKNCCSIGEINYAPPETSPPTLESFLLEIKKRWVESTSYTRTSEKFDVAVSDIPPVIAPSMRGARVYNTELEKNSTFLKENGCTKGDPAQLHFLIREGKLEMTKLGEYDAASLKTFCKDCDVPVGGKSMEKMRVALQSLYETLLIGSSPCHGFTKVPGQTGGFYHIVCRHGVTAASKFLTLQESVRDAADLYLSFKIPPLMFLCDTACGFARHMDCRVPDVAKELWGNFAGCFEEPTLGKPPTKDNNVPLLATAEYKSEAAEVSSYDGTLKHPLTGNSRRYVLGDRFHNASNPHKSPLCEYHDINLLLQSNTIKTSYQECENNRKNIRRLRSSCVQEFGTHFFYNYLMDYFQNEDLVKMQRQLVCATLKSNQVLKRDMFSRFVVEDCN